MLIKRLLRKTICLSLLIILLPAFADNEINTSPFFVGGNLGWAWSDAFFTTDVGEHIPGKSYLSSSLNIDAVNQSGSALFYPGIPLAGLVLGYRENYRRLFYSFLTDFSTFTINKRKNEQDIPFPFVPTPFSPTFHYSVLTALNSDWILTLRARLGVSVIPDTVIVFLTGGAALTEFQVKNDFKDDAASLARGGVTNHKTVWGWAVGAGDEIIINSNWSFLVEYLYINFGNVEAKSEIACTGVCSDGVTTIGTSPFITKFEVKANLVRVGVNYYF